jgi:hypothetical protein
MRDIPFDSQIKDLKIGCSFFQFRYTFENILKKWGKFERVGGNQEFFEKMPTSPTKIKILKNSKNQSIGIVLTHRTICVSML